MTETESDCCENTDDKNPNNISNGSKFHHFNQTDHSNTHVQNVYHANNGDSSDDSNIYDGVMEVYNTDKIEFQANIDNISLHNDIILNEKSTNKYSDDVPLDCSIKSKMEPSDLKSQRKYKTLDNPIDNCVNEQKEIKEISDKNLSNEESLNYRPKRNLVRYRTMDDDINYSYQGVSDRIKKLNISYSSDKDKEDDTNTMSITSSKRKTWSASEKKKLIINPEFEQKMNELYYPSPSKPTTSLNNELCNIKNSEKFTFNRLDSNCEIIEENLSPVSETTKQLEQQLSFPTSQNSQVLSPKIPKKTRFARLNKLLNELPDHENTLSQPESLDQSFFTN